MNVTPTDWEVYFNGTAQLPRLAKVLSTYPKLKDVTLKVRPESIEDQWEIFEGFFGLCKKGVSLCFERRLWREFPTLACSFLRIYSISV